MATADDRSGDRLNRFLDDLARGTPTRADRDRSSVDPALRQTVLSLRECDDAPSADPAFTDRLLEDIMLATNPPHAVRIVPTRLPIKGQEGAAQPWEFPTAPRGFPPHRVAATVQSVAAVLLVLVVAAAYVAFGPLRVGKDDAAPVAVPAVGPASASSPVEFVWQSNGGPNLPFAGPSALAIDPTGNLWVADGPTSQFQIFGPDGTFQDVWGEPGRGEGQFDFRGGDHFAGGVAFDRGGGFYVVDTGNERIQRFDAERNYVATLGSEGGGDGQFLRPVAIAVDSTGRVFVSDYLRADVQVFDADGRYQATWGGKKGIGNEQPLVTNEGTGSYGRLNGPSGIAIDVDDNLWVTDRNNNRLISFAPDGSVLAQWGTMGDAPGEIYGSNSVAVDDGGRIYVVDYANFRVQVFDREGRYLAHWGTMGRDEGQFDLATAAVLDGKGHVYVADSAAGRVQKFRLLPPLAP